MAGLCRTPGCGCAAVDRLYCDHCEGFTPICPACGAVYGEHDMTCTVADNYTDCGEGPWPTEEEATTFAHAEVGMPWQVVKGGAEWYVMVRGEDN